MIHPGLAHAGLAHAGQGGGLVVRSVATAVLAAGVAVYLYAAWAARRTPRGWSRWRTTSLLAGGGLMAVALHPGVARLADHDPRGQVVEHLLLGMYAPLALVLSAPMTLALRRMPPPARRRVTRVLRTRWLRPLTHPVTALCLDVGGLYLVYLTPLYGAAQQHALPHALVHLHYLLAGCLFVWTLAGPDPAPHRSGLPLRLVVLGVAVAAHCVLAKLVYARAPLLPPGVHDGPGQLRVAAQWMYYGADLAEVLMAAAVFATWYTRRHRVSPQQTTLCRRAGHLPPAPWAGTRAQAAGTGR